MRCRMLMAGWLLGTLGITPAAAQSSADASWDSVATVLGTRPGRGPGTWRYGFPRSDLAVRMGGVAVAPGLAFGSWIGFWGPADGAQAMGDLVVTSDELPKVLRALDRTGFEITAVHNHLAGEIPAVMYVHFHGHGSAVALAARFDSVLSETATPRRGSPPPAAATTSDTAIVFGALGRGDASGALIRYGFALISTPVRINGTPVPADLALGSPVNLQATEPGRIVATGDFALLQGQVPGGLRALTDGGITTTALHTHLIGEEPKVYYLHFWADGPTQSVATALRGAIDAARVEP